MALPDMHRAEPIPAEAEAAIAELLQSGDLFRYTAAKDAPVSLLEVEFAQMMGTRPMSVLLAAATPGFPPHCIWPRQVTTWCFWTRSAWVSALRGAMADS